VSLFHKQPNQKIAVKRIEVALPSWYLKRQILDLCFAADIADRFSKCRKMLYLSNSCIMCLFAHGIASYILLNRTKTTKLRPARDREILIVHMYIKPLRY
jgi:hypothetical protein